MGKERTKRITFDAPESMAHRLEQESSDQGTTMKDINIQALTLYFKVLEKGGKITFEDGTRMEIIRHDPGKVICANVDGIETIFLV